MPDDHEPAASPTPAVGDIACEAVARWFAHGPRLHASSSFSNFPRSEPEEPRFLDTLPEGAPLPQWVCVRTTPRGAAGAGCGKGLEAPGTIDEYNAQIQRLFEGEP